MGGGRSAALRLSNGAVRSPDLIARRSKNFIKSKHFPYCYYNTYRGIVDIFGNTQELDGGSVEGEEECEKGQPRSDQDFGSHTFKTTQIIILRDNL
jgi:hypothetical protein